MAWYVRRLLVVLCALGLTLGAAGCGNSEDEAHAAEAAHAESPAKDAHGKAAPKDTHGKSTAKGHGETQGHWTYTGPQGQRYWAEVDRSNLSCVDGSAQSPINVANVLPAPLSKVVYDYTLAPVKVRNNGHTIQVDYLPASGFDGGKMVLEGKVYKLRQFHFRRPSEHTVNGRQFPMEVQLVHQADDQSIAVLGVLIEFGAHNPVFDAIWAAMPAKADVAEVADKPFSATSLLPRSLATYRYVGSMTTPPCSEGVSWLLLKTPIFMSQTQVATFRKLFEFNSRYTQPLNGRDVYEDTADP